MEKRVEAVLCDRLPPTIGGQYTGMYTRHGVRPLARAMLTPVIAASSQASWQYSKICIYIYIYIFELALLNVNLVTPYECSHDIAH